MNRWIGRRTFEIGFWCAPESREKNDDPRRTLFDFSFIFIYEIIHKSQNISIECCVLRKLTILKFWHYWNSNKIYLRKCLSAYLFKTYIICDSSTFLQFLIFFSLLLNFHIVFHTHSVSFFVQQYLLDCLTNGKMLVLSMVAKYKAGSGEWTKEKLNKYTSRFQITNSNSNCMCMYHPFSVSFFLAFSLFVIRFISFLFMKVSRVWS